MARLHFLPGVSKSILPVLPEGVTKTEETWTDDYRGTAESLVAAGILEMHQFPGQPERGKTMASYKPDGTPIVKGSRWRFGVPGYMQVVRTGKTRFVVSVAVAEDEGKRRHATDALRELADKRAREAREAQQELAERLDCLPKTADEFQQRLINYIDNEFGPIGLLRQAVCGSGIPFSNIGFMLNAKARRDIEALLSRLVLLISNGGIEPDVQTRDAYIAEQKERAADKVGPEQKPPPQLKVAWSAPTNAALAH